MGRVRMMDGNIYCPEQGDAACTPGILETPRESVTEFENRTAFENTEFENGHDMAARRGATNKPLVFRRSPGESRSVTLP